MLNPMSHLKHPLEKNSAKFGKILLNVPFSENIMHFHLEKICTQKQINSLKGLTDILIVLSDDQNCETCK